MLSAKHGLQGSEKMQDFTLEKPFDGDSAKALEVATTILLPHGFRVVSKTAHEMVFKGPPPPQTAYESTQFWGPSLIKIVHTNRALSLDVEMGEWRRIDKIIARFGMVGAGVIALAAGWATAAAVASNTSSTEYTVIGTFTLAFVTFIALLKRWAVRSNQNRIKDTYETLLANAVILGQDR